MRLLYDMIHARAIKNWHEPLNRWTYPQYAAHWLNCALALREEFEAEGLPETAAAFEHIITEQRAIAALPPHKLDGAEQ